MSYLTTLCSYGDLKTYLLARRHLVTERAREECDEVSCRRLTSMAADVSSGLAYLALNKYINMENILYKY